LTPQSRTTDGGIDLATVRTIAELQPTAPRNGMEKVNPLEAASIALIGQPPSEHRKAEIL
jgi:hypothetical protein